MDDASNLSEADRRRSAFFVFGLPSVVLGCVTLLIGAYSYLSVQPNIDARYVELCHRHLRSLGIAADGLIAATGIDVPHDSANADSHDADPIANDASDATNTRRMFRETMLALKRLSITHPSQDGFKFQSAIVADAFAGWLRDEATRMGDLADEASVKGLMVQSQTEAASAVQWMNRTVRADGPMRNRATLWLVEKQIDQTGPVADADLQAALESLRDLIASDGSNRPAKALLVQGLVRSALAFDSAIPRSDRLAQLSEARKIAASDASTDAVAASFDALALFSLAPDSGVASTAAQDAAFRATQLFHASPKGLAATPAARAAALRAMLIQTSIDEAIDFARSSLDRVPPTDQPDWRRRASELCLNHVVALYLIGDDADLAVARRDVADDGGGSDAVRLIDFCVRFAPDSDQIVGMLLEMTGPGPVGDQAAENRPADADSLSRFLGREIAAARTLVLGDLIEAMRASSSGGGGPIDPEQIEQRVAAVAQADPAYALLATRTVSALVSLKRTDQATAIEWLSTINRTSPGLLAAWFARGKLHLELGQLKDAEECFVFLNKRLPENEEIKGFLKDAARR